MKRDWIKMSKNHTLTPEDVRVAHQALTLAMREQRGADGSESSRPFNYVSESFFHSEIFNSQKKNIIDQLGQTHGAHTADNSEPLDEESVINIMKMGSTLIAVGYSDGKFKIFKLIKDKIKLIYSYEVIF